MKPTSINPSVEYTKISKAINDFENSIMEVTDSLRLLQPDEHKKLFEDLEGTAQSIKFFNHVLSSLYFPSNQKSVRKS